MKHYNIQNYIRYKKDLEATLKRTPNKEFHEYTRNGYLIWANPLVRLMRKSKLVTNMVKPVASAWAEEMAYRASNVGNGNKFGAALFYLAPICTGLGAVLKLFNVETRPESIKSFVGNK
jgi:hypothetical protein